VTPPVPVAVIVLTFNEERNLERCLASVAAWAAQLFVVDSGSTDGTLEIARRHNASVAAHPFESHALQWRWALQNLPLAADWVLGLDADQEVSPELAASIAATIAAPGADLAGAFVCRRQIFQGRWIRHGGYYPKYLLKLFRRDRAIVDAADLVDHHFRVTGPTTRLHGDLIEDNRNEQAIADWVAKHNRYARLQAMQELREAAAGPAGRGPAAVWGSPDDRVRWFKRQWARLPLFVRPWLYFGYRYVLRLGFLDGRPGFVFHFMQALWYRTLVDANRVELERAAHAPASPQDASSETRRISA
jgi:glycosyltransferase involved in cell wall biosynthesis